VEASLEDAVLEVDGETLFHPAWITWTWGEAPAEGNTLLPRSRRLFLGPWASPLRERARVRFAAPPGAASRRGLAVYYRDGDAWGYLGSDTSGTGVAADLVALENVALFLDTTAPEIALEIGSQPARPRLAARIVDRGAGVTWRTLSMEVDGAPLLVEWDPDASRLRAHHRRDLASGRHRLVVTAVDRVGNAARAERSFNVP
jgi:hypothetical protein